MSIRILPQDERPRERALLQGIHTLSLRECIALVLGSGPPKVGCLGLASRVLTLPGDGLPESEQERAFFQAMELSASAHLGSVAGLGTAGRARLLAAFELGRRYHLFLNRPFSAGAQTPPAKAHSDPLTRVIEKIPHPLRSEAREWLGFVPLYGREKLGEFCLIERGVRTHVNIEPAELFARVLALRPLGFYLFHNHPSGDPTPSEMDHELTRRVAGVSGQLGVRLLGHGILTRQDASWILT